MDRINDKYGYTTLNCLIENGRLAVARQLATEAGLTANDIRNTRFLDWACANGHLGLARWATATFSLNPVDARARDNFALCMSCANGHLAVAQWLVEEFGLTAIDARANGDEALSLARMNGHYRVVQWLDTQFSVR
jgi:hypothetical protein